MPTPSLPNPTKLAGDIAAAFIREHAEPLAARIAGPFAWLRGPLASFVRAVADACDALGEQG